MTRMRWETCAVAFLLLGAGTASGQESSKGGPSADATAPTAGTEGTLPSDPNAPHQGPAVPETEGSKSASQGTGSAESEKPTTTRQKAGTYKSAQLRTVTLTVKQVDPDNHRVTFEATVKPEANLTESGRPIKLDQLKEGDTVKASFDPKTGDVIRVDVTPAGGVASKSKK